MSILLGKANLEIPGTTERFCFFALFDYFSIFWAIWGPMGPYGPGPWALWAQGLDHGPYGPRARTMGPFGPGQDHIFLRNSTIYFFLPAGGVRFRFCWLAVYRFLEFLVITGASASKFCYWWNRSERKTAVWESSYAIFRSKTQPFGTFEEIPNSTFSFYFVQTQQSHFPECPLLNI